MKGLTVAILAVATAACALADGGQAMKPVYTVPHELDMLTEMGHPQGMACSEEAVYVACSRGIVKLDWEGRVVKQCLTRPHLGDIACAGDRVYGSYCLWDQPKGESPVMVGMWDKDLNPIMERHYDYPGARGLDGCVVAGDTLYACVDHYGKERFDHPPHRDGTVMMVSAKDLSLKGFREIVFDYPIHFCTQTLGTDGENLLFGNYGAWKDEGNEKGCNFSRATTDLKLLDSRRFDAYYGFAKVPERIAGRREPVFAVVNALGGGQHGWWRDPKGNPARIRFDFYSYDKATGEMTDITDRSQGGGFPETAFIEEDNPLELNAEAWRPGAGDWACVTWRLPSDTYRDFRGYDRIAVDYVNESGEASGTPFQCYVAGPDGHVNLGLHALGGELPAFGHGRCEFRLDGWEKAKRVDPSGIARLYFFLYRPKAVKLKIYRITLLPKGVECPPPADGFRKKVLEPLEKRRRRAGAARFTVLTDRMVRCEWSADGVFEDRPSLTFADRPNAGCLDAKDYETAEKGDGVVIKTPRMTLEWTGGAFDAGNLVVNGVAVLADDAENLLGTQRTLDCKTCLGDVLETMERGILSRRGVTVVDDTATPLFCETGSHWKKWVVERPNRREGSYRDLTVFAYGHDYKGCLGDYVKVAGRIPLPPRWAFGYWWSRYWPYSDADVRELVRQMKGFGVPIDVFVIDMDWHETWGIGSRPDPTDEFGQPWGWTGYTWNRRLFPDPASTISHLHENGCKVALNLHPASGIQPVEDCYEAFAHDYGWTGTNGVPFRADDEKWADCYFKDVLGPLEADGVDFWWLDWQQWTMSKDKPSLSNTFWLNHVFDAHMSSKGGGGKRPMIYHRWGGLGSHRYQVGFSGDSKVSWKMLEAIPWFTATASNVGYGYWGHDIGGHMFPDGDDGRNGELFVRWLQSAVFTPIFKTHSTRDAAIERRIWEYPDHFAMLREAMRLRYRLAPYVYTAAREAYDTGVSMCRPMYYDWPEEDAAYAVTNAYMFGDDILAATISRPMDKAKGVSEIDVWFPEGKWYDVSTGDILDGGRVLSRSYGLKDNPWFVKAGAIIPMYPDGVDNLAHPGTDDLVLLFAPGADRGACEIYEDGGENADYATNFTKTKVVREGSRIVIGPRKGAYGLKFPLMADPPVVKVNGEACGWSRDPRDGAVVVKTPPQDGTRETVVEL